MANTKISALTSASTPLTGAEVLPIVQSGATVKVANNDLRPKQVQSNATSGVLQIAGPSAANVRVMTTPDANFTVARTDAGQTFTGNQQINGTLGVKSTGGIVNVETTTARGSGSNYVTFKDPSGDKGYLGYISGANDGMYLFNLVNAPVLVGVNSSTTWIFDTSSNLVPATAAKGINFTANTPQAGMTSQLLNWYEEGTWTPSASSTVGSITTYASGGTYTRVGRQVTVTAYVDLTNVGTAAGSMLISNFPFKNGGASGAGYLQQMGVARETGVTGATYAVLLVGNSTNGYISSLTGGAITWVSTYQYALSITYYTA